jgi:putative addiction module component (TIGR02574 family)
MKTKDFMAEVIDLPIEERAMIVDSILKSLNPIQADSDKKWAEVAKRRLKELRSGEAKGIPGVDVFQRTWEEFSS